MHKTVKTGHFCFIARVPVYTSFDAYKTRDIQCQQVNDAMLQVLKEIR